MSCAQTSQQIAEKSLALTKNSTVHLVSQTGKSTTLGSGFFVEKDKIATNIHVVAQPGSVFAKINNEIVLAVEGVAAYDVKNNLVILKLAGVGNPLPIGDSNAVEKDVSVSVVGYTNEKYTATIGIIKNIQKSDKWFWMKAATSKENRGGPVLNKTGQVIGINVGYGDGSHNYVIPSNALKVLLAKTHPLKPLSEWQKRKHIRAEVHHSQGETKYFAKDYKNAIVEFDKAIELNPEHIRAFYKRGNSKFKLENYAGSIDDYTHAIKINPQHAKAYYNRGHAKFNLENYAGSIDDYTHAIKLNPENASAYIYRGNTKFRLKNYADGIDDYTHAIKINPENAIIYSNRGGAKIKLGESKSDDGKGERARQLYQEAIDDCTHAIKIDPKNANAYINRSRALMKLADTKTDQGNVAEAKQFYQKAIDDCTHALKTNPESVDAYKNRGIAKASLGDILSEHGEEEKALSLYRSGITDYYKLEDTSLSKLDSEEARKSTVRVMSWIGNSNGFHNGSGFFVDKDKIATNIHVVDTSGAVFVRLMDMEAIWTVEGVITFDVEYDLVVLKISGEGTPLTLGNSELVQNGESVVAVGYPDGKYKVTSGNVHGTRKSDKWLETTAEVSKGNSGGPLLNAKGEVIGINTRSGNYSFAVPSNILKVLLTRSASTEPLAQWQNREHIRAHAYYHEGEKRFYAGEYFKAIKNFENAISHNPKYVCAYNKCGLAKYLLGESKAEQGETGEAQKLYKAAIEDYTHAIEIVPENENTFYYRGQAKRNFGESKVEQGEIGEAQKLYKAAIEDYTHAIELNPKDVKPFLSRGDAKYLLGQSKTEQGETGEAQKLYKAAIEDYTHAIELNPKDVKPFLNRGAAKYLLGQSNAEQGDVIKAEELYHTAIDDYTQAININPKYVHAYNNRGIVKKALGQHEAAEKDFKKAKELESDK